MNILHANNMTQASVNAFRNGAMLSNMISQPNFQTAALSSVPAVIQRPATTTAARNGKRSRSTDSAGARAKRRKRKGRSNANNKKEDLSADALRTVMQISDEHKRSEELQNLYSKFSKSRLLTKKNRARLKQKTKREQPRGTTRYGYYGKRRFALMDGPTSSPKKRGLQYYRNFCLEKLRTLQLSKIGANTGTPLQFKIGIESPITKVETKSQQTQNWLSVKAEQQNNSTLAIAANAVRSTMAVTNPLMFSTGASPLPMSRQMLVTGTPEYSMPLMNFSPQPTFYSNLVMPSPSISTHALNLPGMTQISMPLTPLVSTGLTPNLTPTLLSQKSKFSPASSQVKISANPNSPFAPTHSLPSSVPSKGATVSGTTSISDAATARLDRMKRKLKDIQHATAMDNKKRHKLMSKVKGLAALDTSSASRSFGSLNKKT